MQVRIEKDICRNIGEALSLEWLETDGAGGYASSTILMCHTRKYHGLLVPNLADPPGRHVLLSKFEDSVFVKNEEFFFSCHQYPGVFFPDSTHVLQGYEFDYCPRFVFKIGTIVIHRRIMLVQGGGCVLVRYSCESGGTLRLRLKPFLAFRGHHRLSKENSFIRRDVTRTSYGFEFQPYEGMPGLIIQTSGEAEFTPMPLWYKDFEYVRERERGYDFREDLFMPGLLEMELAEGREVYLSASIRECGKNHQALWEDEKNQRKQASSFVRNCVQTVCSDGERKMLEGAIRSGRCFPVRTPTGRNTVVAGYHWFSDWGRDTLISLPGLTFCSGRPQDGVEILKAIGEYERGGLLPNFFTDAGKAAYNSVDSSLWYFWSVQQMMDHTGDLKTVEESFWPVMKKIIRNFMAGTDHEIYAAGNGLLHAGDSTTQLTWMDASVDGRPVTPRAGYAVEVNALWYNALCFAKDLSDKFQDGDMDLKDTISNIRDSFEKVFWVEDGSYLADVFTGNGIDPSVRPNQIIAVSLPYRAIDADKCEGVVERVVSDLLTPYGLRTLSPADPAYIGRYRGDPEQRDTAYHQGTVWPWLIGPFGDAYLKTYGRTRKAKEFLLEQLIIPLNLHRYRAAGLGFISEIFDGDPPYHPNGCIAQAWSTAEFIRLLVSLSHIP